MSTERMTDLLLLAHVVVGTSSMLLSFGRLRQKIPLKSVPHMQHDYFSSLDQSND